MDEDNLKQTLSDLLSLSRETEWVEFKLNNDAPEEIGEYLSAIANSVALHRKTTGYIAWGVDDASHAFLGTSFKPHRAKVQGQELENWLTMRLQPRIDFRIHEFMFGQKRAVLFQVPPALHSPVQFKGEEFIRIGSYKKKLRDHPEKERALWQILSHASFEGGVAVSGVSADRVLELINFPRLFESLGEQFPDRHGILHRLSSEKVITRIGADRFDVTNLGGLLFARRLSDFDRLSRKALRIIIYSGNSRVCTKREELVVEGYAAGFPSAIKFIRQSIPVNEQIEEVLRTEEMMYPGLAIRELIANALIHQDFVVQGTGPMVEIFDDRMEISNPGTPLIKTDRFIDFPPQSRNESLAAFMRRLNMCEERGSGIDKVVWMAELFQLPPPDFSVTDNHTRAVLFAPRDLNAMEQDERIRACYQHACLRFVSGQKMTNESLRKRFAIEEWNYSIASRIIRDTIDSGWIKQFGKPSRRYAKYVPVWAYEK